jgi:hypothetical protein
MTGWTYDQLDLLRRRVADLVALADLDFHDQSAERLAQTQREYAAEHNLGLDAGVDPTYDPAHDPNLDTGVEAGV